jgi:hypothetical protein
VLYHNKLLDFDTKQYIDEPEQLWLVESIVGSQTFTKSLSSTGRVTARFIESLFKSAPFSFYLSADGSYLLGNDDELTQLAFGPLTRISTLDALKRFGVSTLERAKEKTVKP